MNQQAPQMLYSTQQFIKSHNYSSKPFYQTLQMEQQRKMLGTQNNTFTPLKYTYNQDSNPQKQIFLESYSKFQQINWKNIQKLDIEGVHARRNYQQLQSYVPNILKSTISDLEFQNNQGQNKNNYKLLKLIQIQLQYMEDKIFQDDEFINENKEIIKDYQQTENYLKKETAKLQNEIKLLQFELQKNIEQHHKYKKFLATNPQFKCSFCVKKYFINEEALDKHVQKRHGQFFVTVGLAKKINEVKQQYIKDEIQEEEHIKQEQQQIQIRRKEKRKTMKETSIKQQDIQLMETFIVENPKIKIKLEDVENQNPKFQKEQNQKILDQKLQYQQKLFKYFENIIKENDEEQKQLFYEVEKQIKDIQHFSQLQQEQKQQNMFTISNEIIDLQKNLDQIQNKILLLNEETTKPDGFFNRQYAVPQQLAQSTQHQIIIEEKQPDQKAESEEEEELNENQKKKIENLSLKQEEKKSKNLQLSNVLKSQLQNNKHKNNQNVEVEEEITADQFIKFKKEDYKSQNQAQNMKDENKISNVFNQHGIDLSQINNQQTEYETQIKQEQKKKLEEKEHQFFQLIQSQQQDEAKINDLDYKKFKNLIPYKITQELNQQNFNFSVQELNTLSDIELEKIYKQAKKDKIDEAIFIKNNQNYQRNADLEEASDIYEENEDDNLNSDDNSINQNQLNEKSNESDISRNSMIEKNIESNDFDFEKNNSKQYPQIFGRNNNYQRQIKRDHDDEQDQLITQPHYVGPKDWKTYQFYKNTTERGKRATTIKRDFQQPNQNIAKKIYGYNPNSFPKNF